MDKFYSILEQRLEKLFYTVTILIICIITYCIIVYAQNTTNAQRFEHMGIFVSNIWNFLTIALGTTLVLKRGKKVSRV